MSGAPAMTNGLLRPLASMNAVRVTLVGNPNCGKTTLFNALTGGGQKVGNWAGVTVERATGFFLRAGQRIEVTDLPGIYSLDAVSGDALDEAVARDHLLSGEAGVVVNVVDAGQLARNLYLTTQLLEMRLPLVVAVNMLDRATQAGLRIDCRRLSELLGCPVVPLTAAQGKGGDALEAAILAQARAPQRQGAVIRHAPVIEAALRTLIPRLQATAGACDPDPRWRALRLLEDDPPVTAWADADIRDEAARLRARCEAQAGEEADVLIADARYEFIQGLLDAAVTQRGKAGRSLTERMDRIVLHRLFGLPVFLGVMYLLFVFSFNGGNVFIDFFNGVAHALFVSSPRHVLAAWHSPPWLVSLVADAVGGALVLLSTFIAPIGLTFASLAFLEASGYMARAAFVMDRLMRRLGLPGKAFVPMIVGFGCNVPAVMATRTLEHPRERLAAALMQPFMSCSARLVIYMAFAAVFFREHGGQVVFALYLLGILAAIGTAFLLRRTALEGEVAPFVMEMPVYQVPTLRALARSAWDRLWAFLRGAGKLIIIAAVAVNVLMSFSLTGKPLNETQIGESALATVGKALTPAFRPMGISDENWPATVGLLSGVLVKEVLLGSLNGVYARMDVAAAPAAPPAFDPLGELEAAAASIVHNARDFAAGFLDPLGLGALGRVEQADLQQAAAQLQVEAVTLGRMGALFSVPAAIAYLIFVLLYMPCVNTMAAIYRETGSRGWTAFSALWGLQLAYGLAVLFYQFATFAQHPVQSLLWLGAILASFALTVAALRIGGGRVPKLAQPA